VASSLRFRVDSADVSAATTVLPPPPLAKRAKETSGRAGRTTGRPAMAAQAAVQVEHRYQNISVLKIRTSNIGHYTGIGRTLQQTEKISHK